MAAQRASVAPTADAAAAFGVSRPFIHPPGPTMKTDKQLQRDVNNELQWEPSVHAAMIGVEVKDGVVTLAGQVDSYTEKWRAERAAQRVAGVQAMSTELKVKLPGDRQRTDADIAGAVSHVLAWTSLLAPDTIQVMVERGWVTLGGEVDWQYQREAVLDSVRTLMGVTGLSDLITVKPAVTVMAVQADIEAALQRRSIADANQIKVAVHGSDVTLSGTVQSWEERSTATNSAWGMPGVRNVIDKLTLLH